MNSFNNKLIALAVIVLALGIGIGVPLMSRMNIHDLQASVTGTESGDSEAATGTTQQKSIECYVNPPDVFVGDPVVWQVKTAGPDNPGAVTFTWQGAAVGLGQTFENSFDAPGIYSATVSYNDPVIGHAKASCSVNVLANPNTPQAGGSSAQSAVSSQSESAASDLTPAPDILHCKIVNPDLVLGLGQTAELQCRLEPPASVTARIIKGDYTPSADLDPASIVKTIEFQKTKYSQLLNYSWDGNNSYDQQVPDGEYSFVVSALRTSNTRPAISIQKLFVTQNPPAQTQQNLQPGTGTAAVATDLQTGSQQSQQSALAQKNISQSEETAPAGNTAASPSAASQEQSVPPGNTTISSGPSKCPGVNYPDDIGTSWAKNFIMTAYDRCIFSGYTGGHFMPDQPMTRFEALKVTLRAAGIAPKQGCYSVDCGTPFRDLAPEQGQWVRAAWDHKIITGVDGNLFDPQRLITRKEVFMIVPKAFGIQPHQDCYSANCGTGYPDNFFLDVTDKTLGSYLRAMWDLNIVQGTAPHTFSPDRTLTRAEMAALLIKTGQALGKINPESTPEATQQVSGTLQQTN
jgi:hypothetical protein